MSVLVKLEQTEMQSFSNELFGRVRVLVKDNEPWFIAKDVADALEFRDPYTATRNLDEDEKLLHTLCVSGQNRETTLINESGLYSLILKSNKQEAKKFKKWVTSEVLPSIRKHGAYMTDNTLEQALTNPDFLIRLATNLKEEQEKRKLAETKVEVLEGALEENKPYTNFGKSIANSSDSITVGTFAKLLSKDGFKIGRNSLFVWLRSNGYVIKIGKEKNLPQQKYIKQGLFEVNERVVHTVKGDIINPVTLITGKGQMYFLEKIKKHINS